jgi:hypothetical protein
MNRLGRVVLGAIVGGILGFAIPVLAALMYVGLGGDRQAAGAFSFFPILLVPLGLYFGGMMGSVWGPDSTLTQNVWRGFGKVLSDLWKTFKPRWI